MKNLTEITAIVREYLGDTSATVTQPILDSINFLSNLFSVDTIDSTQSTVIGDKTLSLPTNNLEVDAIRIDDDEVRELKNLDDLDNVNAVSEQRWYIFNEVIQFTQKFTAVDTVAIYFKKGFIEPTLTDDGPPIVAGTDTDVPAKLMELVYIGAQYRYFNKLITLTATSKDDVPDVSAKDLRLIRDDLNKHYLGLLKIIKLNE